MKLTLALLLIGTTLGTGSAALAASQGGVLMPRPALVGLHPVAIPDAAVTLIDNDDDDEGGRFRWLSGNDDDDDEDDDECEGEDDDDDDCAAGNAGNAAKAGSVAPPKNGLFTNGTAPVVKSN